MQKLKSLEISFLECQRFRSQILWKLLEIDKVNTNTSPLKIDSATSMCFIGIFIFNLDFHSRTRLHLPACSPKPNDSFCRCLLRIHFVQLLVVSFSTAQRRYYNIPLQRSNQQTIILGTPILCRISCISQYPLGTQSNEWAVKYMGILFSFLFFQRVCLKERRNRRQEHIFLCIFLNRKIKYEEKYASWTKLC